MRARTYKQSILVGYVRRADIRRVRRDIQRQPVDNDSDIWNCQNWILEVIDYLHGVHLLQVIIIINHINDRMQS